MGMFDTIYAELTCPFCGRQYLHTPLSWEQAKCDCDNQKEGELKYAQPPDNPWDELFRHTQAMRARADGFALLEVEQKGLILCRACVGAAYYQVAPIMISNTCSR